MSEQYIDFIMHGAAIKVESCVDNETDFVKKKKKKPSTLWKMYP